MSTGSTVMPRPASDPGRAARIVGDATVYPTVRAFVKVPGVRPVNLCHRKEKQWLCTRPLSHKGRCAHIRWELGGLVRAVWGFKPDVSKARKVSAEKIRARLETGVSA